MKRYIKSVTLEDKRNKENPYLYFTKHGTGPGTLPRDVNLMKEQDFDDYMTAIWVDRPLSSEELEEYDIYPETMNTEFKEKYNIESAMQTYYPFDANDFDEPDPPEASTTDVVLYVDGDEKYEGDIYDPSCKETFENLCEDPDIYEKLFAFCQAIDMDSVTKDWPADWVGDTVWQIVIGDFDGLRDNFSEDFDDGQVYKPSMEMYVED